MPDFIDAFHLLLAIDTESSGMWGLFEPPLSPHICWESTSIILPGSLLNTVPLLTQCICFPLRREASKRSWLLCLFPSEKWPTHRWHEAFDQQASKEIQICSLQSARKLHSSFFFSTVKTEERRRRKRRRRRRKKREKEEEGMKAREGVKGESKKEGK